MSDQGISAESAFLLALIVGIAPIFISSVMKNKSEKRALRLGFKAELSAILDSTEQLNHAEYFGKYLQDWKIGVNLDEFPQIPGIENRTQPPVFKSNTDKLGVLGDDVCEDIVKFYTIYEGIMVDIASLGGRDVQERMFVVEMDLKRWSEILDLARSLISRL